MVGQKRYVGWFYVLPALLLFTGTVIVPIIWSMTFSVFRWNGLGRKVFIGIGNYAHMLDDRIFRASFFNNLLFAGLGTVVQLAIGMIMAMLLMSIRTFRDFIKIAYFVPCVISSVAICQIFAQLLSANPEGMINASLGALGLVQFKGAFLSDPHLVLIIVTLVDAYKFCAIYMVIYYAAFMSVDAEILDAASIDGANWWQQYVYLKFPLIKAVIIITLVTVVSGTLKGFDVSYILTYGGPGAASELVSTYLYKTVFNSSNFGYGSAIGVFLVFECLVIVAVTRHVFRQKTAEG